MLIHTPSSPWALGFVFVLWYVRADLSREPVVLNMAGISIWFKLSMNWVIYIILLMLLNA